MEIDPSRNSVWSQPDIHQHRLAAPGQRTRTGQSLRHLGHRAHQDAFGAEACRHLVIGGAREHGGDVVVQHLHLLARDLRPAGVVADQRDDRDAVAHEGVELRRGRSRRRRRRRRSRPRRRAGTRRAEREARADAERAEGAPDRASSSGPRGCNTYDAVATKSPPSATRQALSPRFAFERAKQRDRVDQLAARLGLAVDLGLALGVARAQLRRPTTAKLTAVALPRRASALQERARRRRSPRRRAGGSGARPARCGWLRSASRCAARACRSRAGSRRARRRAARSRPRAAPGDAGGASAGDGCGPSRPRAMPDR